MGIPPARWLAADGVEINVWQPIVNIFYSSPVICNLLKFSFDIEDKYSFGFDIETKYDVGGYCCFCNVVLRHSDKEIRSYR